MHIGVCIAVSSYLVIARSSPITNLDPLPIPACCLGFLLLPFLVGSYLVQGISFWVSTRTAARRNRWRWAVLPVCLLLVASTFAGNWPLRLRFAFSRSAFEREAKNLLASSQIGETRHGRFVGLYYVEIIRVDPATSSVYFLTGEVGLIDRVGFVYSPYFPQKFGQYLSPPWYGYED